MAFSPSTGLASPLTLRAKLSLSFASLLAMAAVLLWMVVPARLEELSRDWAERRAAGIVLMLGPAIKPGVDFEQANEVQRFLDWLSGTPGAQYGRVWKIGEAVALAEWHAKEGGAQASKALGRADLPTGVDERRFFYRGGSLHIVTLLTTASEITFYLAVGFSTEDLEQERRRGQVLVAALAAGLLVGGLILAWLLGTFLTRPIVALTEASLEISRTRDLSKRVEAHSRDEVGTLANTFNTILDQQRELVERAGNAGRTVNDVATNLVSVGEAVVRGGESVRDRVGVSLEATANLGRAIGGMSDTVSGARESSEQVGAAIIEMAATNQQVAARTYDIAAAITEVSQGVEQMRHSASTIASSVAELDQSIAGGSSAMTQMHASIREVDGHARRTAELSDALLKDAKHGEESIAQTLQGIGKISDASKTTLEVIQDLEGEVHQIEGILAVIEDVAEQTNLLALNAAIIAAQAGEHGRGFGVVAQEIKTLADRTRGSTSQIGKLVGGIVHKAGNAVVAVRRAADSAVEGAELGERAVAALSAIGRSAGTANTMAQSIAFAMVEQAEGAGQMLKTVEAFAASAQGISRSSEAHARGAAQVLQNTVRLSSLAQEVARSTQEQAKASQQINESTAAINDLIGEVAKAQGQQDRAAHSIVAAVSEIKVVVDSQGTLARRLESEIDALRVQAADLKQELEKFKVHA